MAETSTRRGLEMIPIVLMADMDWCDSTLGDFAGVEKKFLVAFRASETARRDAEAMEAVRCGGEFDAGDRFVVERRVSDDAAFADVFAAKFELRLDENEKRGAGLCREDGRRKNFCDGDEGDIGDDEVDRFGDFVCG